MLQRREYFRFKCKKLVDLAVLKKKKWEQKREKKVGMKDDEKAGNKYYEKIYKIVEKEFWKNCGKIKN